ncbi:prepilin-type N-terminal cleavage/methylation domain-containing protein [Candidatus Poribacteria bacterium]|nr:prepilin-type N-terminal cleavage/methylation domain-containing protein [Candidatus Poribacteria bacterium]
MKNRGFTLVELMTAITVLVIISGTAYAAFQMALRVYNRETTRVILIQNCRNAVNQIANDLSNTYIVEGDTDLQFMAEDIPKDEGEQDTVTFVTLIDPRPDPLLAQLSSELETAELTEEEATQPQTDLVRVFYYLKIDEEADEATLNYDENPPLSLFRAKTTGLALSGNESIEEIISRGTVTVTTASGEEEEVPVEEIAIADHIQSLDFKYSDGEEWYESWDNTERPPKAVQVIVTVTDEGGKGITLTQSTMVYLTLTANFSDEEQASSSSGQAGAQSGGSGGGQGGGQQ